MPIKKKKRLKLVWRLPQNRRFYGKMECLPLWPTYIGEKGRTLGKTYGIGNTPWGTHWEPREHIGNLMGTHWELEGNMLGTKEKWKKMLPSFSFFPFFLPFLSFSLSLHFISYLFFMFFSFSMFPYYLQEVLSFSLFLFVLVSFFNVLLSLSPCFLATRSVDICTL